MAISLGGDRQVRATDGGNANRSREGNEITERAIHDGARMYETEG